ncbi:endoglucanase 13-like [Triticum urartu]|uniref:Endoglucanase n=1 Tax=Triticum urartu TaxID=4572 RepID=A0A8R7PLQ1_TRIUA|nr:endoglucanase 13-like [Triticum dicoccoides]XP_048553660.1 endoglucanase 13-like [Triticum urartu]XP_048553663.1 endoglucanase 13-like [Triticum urartu]
MARLTIASAAAVALLVLLAAASAEASPAWADYAGAFDKSLQFFEAQRSGKLPADRTVHWRGDSALTDGFSQGVDLVGGYYDAGDHVKFGFPAAYAVTMLSWGVLEFEKEMVAANSLNRALDAIRWGTNYFIKAHTEPNTLWVQVGDGDSDHLCWERAEDMSTPRTASKIDASRPGSEVAAETAAALAAAAKVFRHYDSMYADLLLMHAKQIFTFADTFRGRYDDSLQCAKKFYPSASGYQDELLWGAAWLYEATGDQDYLDYVARNADAFGGTGWAVREFSWDNKYAGVQVLLSKVLLAGGGDGDYADTLKQFRAKAEFFMCACIQKNGGNNVRTTPGGLLYVADWNNMQYVSSSVFLLTVYADYLAESGDKLKCPDAEVAPAEIVAFARSQVDYVLGKNPLSMSYMVGHGDKFPTHVHHRGASIPSVYAVNDTVGCMEGFDAYYNSKGADPNVLVGALVGGPDGHDGFVDDRCNYQRAEPTLAAAAPMCGVFARLAAQPAAAGNSPGYQPPQDTLHVGGAPLEFVHAVTNSWEYNGVDHYRHTVTAKNTCGHPITYLKLRIEGLTGPIYGVSATQDKEMYGFPSWVTRLDAGEKLTIVYIQEGGPAAKIAVAQYKTG